MGMSRKKKKEAAQSTREAIEIGGSSIAVGFNIQGDYSGSRAFVGHSSSISRTLGTEDTWTDVEDELEETYPTPALI